VIAVVLTTEKSLNSPTIPSASMRLLMQNEE
jgi:hypothetical protein